MKRVIGAWVVREDYYTPGGFSEGYNQMRVLLNTGEVYGFKWWYDDSKDGGFEFKKEWCKIESLPSLQGVFEWGK